MDHITDVATQEPAIALLYFLIFLIPFMGAMAYMIRQNNRWRRIYTSLYKRMWVIAAKLEVGTNLKQEDDLNTLITTNAINALEEDLILLESKAELAKATVISNTYMPKPQKLKILAKRLAKVENHIKQSTSTPTEES